MTVFTVAFFGHRSIFNTSPVLERLDGVVENLIKEKEYVEFLVGRNGDFDCYVASAVRRAKKKIRDDNNALVLVLPYLTAEYRTNAKSFHEYYDEVEICPESAAMYFKAAIQKRNRQMVDRADLIVCCIDHKSNGAYRTLLYAQSQGKMILNLAADMSVL